MNEPRVRRDLLISALHVAVLWAFAIAQPLFDVLSNNAEFFVARGNGAADILIFSIGLVVLPPAGVLALEWVLGRFSSRLSSFAHFTIIGALSSALALQVLQEVAPDSGWPLIAIAIAIGALAAFLYASKKFVDSFLTVLSPAPALFLVLFFFFSPVSELILPQEEVEARAVDVGSKAPVVMVVFDELPVASLLDSKGRIDESRYPHFAALARNSTWYREATTLEPYSNAAVPAILSGQLSQGDSLPLATDYPDNLFTLLGGSYRMNVHEAISQLCPTSLCPDAGPDDPLAARLGALTSDLSVVSGHILLPDELSRGLPKVDQAFEGFRDEAPGGSAQALNRVEIAGEQPLREDRSGQFARFLASIRAENRTFNFHHSVLPHTPWEFLPSGDIYSHQSHLGNYTVEAESRWTEHRWLVEQAWQRHLLQVGYVDRLLGQIEERMKEVGIWRRALLVVTADHGISFQPGDQRRVPTATNLGGIAGVPLFVKEPHHQTGRISGRPTCTTEIPSIVMEALDADPLEESQACSAENVRVGPIDISVSRFRDQREEVVGAMTRAFGTEPGWQPILHHGPHDGIVGSRPALFPPASTSDAKALIIGAQAYGAIDLDQELPLLVQGTVTGPFDPGTPLAIAVNDQISAVTRVYRLGGAGRFQALIPRRALREGANAIEVFRVDNEQRRIRLEPLTD